MAGEMASRWCREAINVFLMDDWAVDQFWHLVWDLSAAGFGLPGLVNLSELTGTVGFVWSSEAKGCFFGGNWRSSDIRLVSRLCFEAIALVYQGCSFVARTWSRQQVVVAV
jgi:hypothetical protein